MIIDNSWLFDSASAITVSATTQSSSNIVDLVNARDLGVGTAYGATPKLMVLVTTAFSTTNSATLKLSYQGSTDSTTWSTYAVSDTFTPSQMTAGTRLMDVDMPRKGPGEALPRYHRILYTVGTGIFSAGAVTSAIVLGRDDSYDTLPYPSGFTVSN